MPRYKCTSIGARQYEYACDLLSIAEEESGELVLAARIANRNNFTLKARGMEDV